MMHMCRGVITKAAVGDYTTGMQLGGGAYAASNTLAAAPADLTNSTMDGVYPQQIPAIATGGNSSSTLVPQTTLGPTNSSVPANASSPLSGGSHEMLMPLETFILTFAMCPLSGGSHDMWMPLETFILTFAMCPLSGGSHDMWMPLETFILTFAMCPLQGGYACAGNKPACYSCP